MCGEPPPRAAEEGRDSYESSSRVLGESSARGAPTRSSLARSIASARCAGCAALSLLKKLHIPAGTHAWKSELSPPPASAAARRRRRTSSITTSAAVFALSSESSAAHCEAHAAIDAAKMHRAPESTEAALVASGELSFSYAATAPLGGADPIKSIAPVLTTPGAQGRCAAATREVGAASAAAAFVRRLSPSETTPGSPITACPGGAPLRVVPASVVIEPTDCGSDGGPPAAAFDRPAKPMWAA